VTGRGPTSRRSRQAAAVVARRQSRLALLESLCQRCLGGLRVACCSASARSADSRRARIRWHKTSAGTAALPFEKCDGRFTSVSLGQAPPALTRKGYLALTRKNYFDPSSKRRATRFGIPRYSRNPVRLFFSKASFRPRPEILAQLSVVIRSTMRGHVISLSVCCVMRNIGVDHS